MEKRLLFEEGRYPANFSSYSRLPAGRSWTRSAFIGSMKPKLLAAPLFHSPARLAKVHVTSDRRGESRLELVEGIKSERAIVAEMQYARAAAKSNRLHRQNKFLVCTPPDRNKQQRENQKDESQYIQ